MDKKPVEDARQYARSRQALIDELDLPAMTILDLCDMLDEMQAEIMGLQDQIRGLNISYRQQWEKLELVTAERDRLAAAGQQMLNALIEIDRARENMRRALGQEE